MHNFLYHPLNSSFLDQNIFLSTLLFNSLNLRIMYVSKSVSKRIYPLSDT